MKRRIYFAGLVGILALPLVVPAEIVAEETAADLLPATTIAYVHIDSPAKLVNLAEEHPLRDWALNLPDVKKNLGEQQLGMIRGAVRLVEAEFDEDWRPLLADVTAGGVSAGFDAATEGVAVFVRGNDPERMTMVQDMLLRLARVERAFNDKEEIEEIEYRDVMAYRIDQAYLAAVGPYLTVTNKAELGKAIVDRWLDGEAGGTSLASAPGFRAAREADAESFGWAYVDVKTIRDADIAERLYTGKTENPLAELLVGGLAGVLPKTPYITARLNLDAEGVGLVVATPWEDDWIEAAREHYFGEKGRGVAPAILAPEGTILSVSAYRDFGRMWSSAPDLYDDRTNAEIAEANSNLSTLFGGRDLGRDILGGMEPQLQFVVAEQHYKADNGATPTISLPSAALVLEMKDANTMSRQLKVSFQSLIGFVNIAAGQQGQPPLELMTERLNDAEIITSSYMMLEDEMPDELPIQFNFTPSMVIDGERLVLSTTLDLAKKVLATADAPTDATPAQDAASANTTAVVRFAPLAATLAANRDHLIHQNMIEKGHPREAAETEIDTLLSLVNQLGGGRFAITSDDRSLEVELEVTFANK